MPRKTSTAATQDYLRADYNRWRLLARNRDFQKDLADYLNKYEKVTQRFQRREGPFFSLETLKKIDSLKQKFLAKWGIKRVPDFVHWQEKERTITPQGLERWYQAAKKDRAEFSVRGDPVSILGSRIGSRSNQLIIELSVDLSLSADQIVPLIHKQLKETYFGQRPREKPPCLDFHLQVFDLIHTPRVNGQRLTFADVSRKLEQKLSSIRDAYFSAYRKIKSVDLGFALEASLKSTFKKSPLLWDLIKEDEFKEMGPNTECFDRMCRDAKTDKDYCPIHRAALDKGRRTKPRSLPPDLTKQQAILGAVLRAPSTLKALREQVAKGYRILPQHKPIYQAILDLDKRGSTINKSTVSERLRQKGKLETIGGVTYLTDLHNLATSYPRTLNHASSDE